MDIKLGQTLKELRRKNKVSQLEISKEFDISQGYISDVENGIKSVTLELLFLYAKKFKKKPSQVLALYEKR